MQILKNSPIFSGMEIAEIEAVIDASRAIIKSYKKDEFIFLQDDAPDTLHILVEGTVVIGNDSSTGKRNIITTFSHAGEPFGEVFLFLGKAVYDNYSQAATDSKILQIPKSFFDNKNEMSSKIISNMLEILAKKAYYLHKKLLIISGGGLREKIIRTLLQNIQGTVVKLGMNREEFADYLNVARPSLSRELMKMQDEGLIEVEGDRVRVLDVEGLSSS